jgi:hypothetical protein
MERNFTNENFERFLRQNADGLRMRPPDKVWSGISRNLNRRKRRFGFLLLTSLMIATGLGYHYTAHAPRINTPASFTRPVAQSGMVSNEPPASPRYVGSRTTGIRHQSTLMAIVAPGKTDNNGILSVVPEQEKQPADPDNTVSAPNNPFTATIIDSYTEEYPKATASSRKKVSYYPDPLTIESIINSFHKKDKRFGMQLNFTPTISYRHLSDDSIDQKVTHKPYFGFQLGLTTKYAVSNRVKLLGGLQFSVNRYGIKTNKSSTELAVYKLNHGTDSINTVTNYNNVEGYHPEWLQNFYFQISAPVGVEVKLKGDENMHFGVASTLQPTYVIGDRAYLISSDYINYAEMPRLIRRWNVNASLETFVAYTTGHLKWQVGPQVRYQLLSSFDKAYPVKENLFDFGLKMGISLNNKH